MIINNNLLQKLSRRNYVAWENGILRSLSGNSALHAEITKTATFESAIDAELQTERDLRTRNLATLKTSVQVDREQLADLRKSYRITQMDFDEYSQTLSSNDVYELLGVKAVETWCRMQRSENPVVVANKPFLNLGMVKELRDKLIKNEEQIIETQLKLDENSQQRSQKASLYSDARKRLRTEAGALCNQILSPKSDGLLDKYYLEELQSHQIWASLTDAQMRADIHDLMEQLYTFQKNSIHSSPFDVLQHLWTCNPEPGESLNDFDSRFYEAVEYWRRDPRLPVSEELLQYLYTEALRCYGNLYPVSQFLGKYLVSEKPEKFDNLRASFHQAMTAYNYSINHDNSSQYEVEDMVVSAAVEKNTFGVPRCSNCHRLGHPSHSCTAESRKIAASSKTESSLTPNNNNNTTSGNNSNRSNKSNNTSTGSGSGNSNSNSRSNLSRNNSNNDRQNNRNNSNNRRQNTSNANNSSRNSNGQAQNSLQSNSSNRRSHLSNNSSSRNGSSSYDNSNNNNAPTNRRNNRNQSATARAAVVESTQDRIADCGSENDDVGPSLYICPSIVVAAGKESDDVQSSLQLDNGANTNILNNPNFFEGGPQPLERPVHISGIYSKGSNAIAMGGQTKHFGFAYFEPTARNIISQHRVEMMGYRTTPVKNNNNITIAWKIQKGNINIHFPLKNGIFERPVPRFMIAAATRSASQPAQSTVLPDHLPLAAASPPEVEEEPDASPAADIPSDSTPEQEPSSDRPYSTNLGRKLTKAEEEKVNMMLKLHVTLGHPGRAAETKLISGGHLLNCPLTTKDIDLCYELHPTCMGCLKGKMRAPASPAFSPPTGAIMGQYWEGDIMFIGPRRYVILVEVLSNFAISIPVTTRHESAISNAAKVWQSYLRSYFNVSNVTVYTDREGGLRGLASISNNDLAVVVQRAPTEGHANRVEVLIRTIKERSRSIIFSLPYKLPNALLDYLVRFIVQMKNILPATNVATDTPLERVRGIKLSYSDLKSLEFGATGHAVVPSDQRGSKENPTSEEGILVGFDLLNPRNKIVYIINSKRQVSRIKFVKSNISKQSLLALQSDPFNMLDLESNVVSAAVLSPEDDVSNMSIKVATRKFGEEATRESCISELQNMTKMNVFKFVKPKDVKGKIYPSKVFLKAKYTDGKFSKLKSRIVLRGDLQKVVDKSITKSPTIQRGSLNTILSLNKLIKGEIYSADIPAAFLFADLNENIHMSLNSEMSSLLLDNDPALEEFTDNAGRIVVKLQKSIYGLRQAPLNFYKLMRSTLTDIGFTVSSSDGCIFSQRRGKEVTMIAIHVDDLLVSSNSPTQMNHLKKKLSEKYGELSWSEKEFPYLGMYLKRNSDFSVDVDMTAYSLNLVEKFADVFVDYSTKIKDPSDLKLFQALSAEHQEAGNSDDSRRFKSIVMALMYLTNVRTDIQKECIILAMMANNPNETAWNALKRVLRYISKFPSCSINLGADSTELYVYSDAGYAEHYDGRSHSGMFITLGSNGGPIITKSKKQTLVTQSSTEAEMLAFTDAIKRAFPVAKLLVELGFNDRISIIGMQDNKSTIHLANAGEGFGGKAKHFRVRYHFLKELVAEGSLKIVYCNTNDMIADVLTKPMVGTRRMKQIVRIMFKGDEESFKKANEEALSRVQSKKEVSINRR